MRTLDVFVNAKGTSGGRNGYANLSALHISARKRDGEITFMIDPITSRGHYQTCADLIIDEEAMSAIVEWYNEVYSPWSMNHDEAITG